MQKERTDKESTIDSYKKKPGLISEENKSTLFILAIFGFFYGLLANDLMYYFEPDIMMRSLLLSIIAEFIIVFTLGLVITWRLYKCTKLKKEVKNERY